MKNYFLMLMLMLSSVVAATEITPTVRLYQSLAFADDMQFENIDLAIERQLLSFERSGLKGTIRFGTKVYPKSVLKDSLLELKALVHVHKKCQKNNPRSVCSEEFNRAMNEAFAIYVPRSKKTASTKQMGTTKFTSYYSPDLSGSRVPTKRFKHAIYRMPDRAEDRNHTRVNIDFNGVLAGKGYEIFWVEDSFFDLYLLHVQGGGRIKVHNPDGSKEVRYLSYDGKNSQPFQMIYKYMLRMGYLRDDASVPAQRRFLEENPHKQEEIFNICPSYVYFKESKEEPVGLDDIPLTEGRSLAIDNTIYKTMGIINFVKTVKASHVDERGRVVKVPFSRFFIAQDTGGAIRGAARCDLYFGYGPLAELTAYNMNEMGEQYFLIKK